MIIMKYAYKDAAQPKLTSVGMSVQILEDMILSAKN